MNIWLVYREEDSKKNTWYIDQFLRLGPKYGMNISLVFTNDLTLVCDEEGNRVLLYGQKVPNPTLAIIRTIDPRLSIHFELSGIPVVNSSQISAICNDKARTYQEIAKLSIPMVPTQFCKRDCLLESIQKKTEKTVVKTVDGHGGQEVFLIDPADDVLHEMIGDILAKTYSDFVIQPIIGTRHQDLRVYVLGNQILAAVLRTSTSGFRANFSLGGEVEEYHLSESESRRVYEIIDHFTFDLVGIDFIIDDDNTLVFNEIEDVVGARMLYQSTAIDIVDCYLEYLNNKYINL